ncbi:act minimal PKS acyl carrier protein [Amycolatopsis echigonensis]|uniref:Act minimal PKS acyl carrier protein n=1 Tax=Amycolatopsis echigonensis TaxID=2576905 RepID=A0A2N3WJA8_9PSEU|nr:acyl carrier protein [Amycolatopsis niigatensis]PKV93960.1 act minimal PKS acyl carrier protein [Amycolatopsis niigatensis]
MSKFTIEELTGLMRSCAGEADSTTLTGDILDVSFADLGYDSLALLEISAYVRREFGVTIPEDVITELDTPRQYVDYVSAELATA